MAFFHGIWSPHLDFGLAFALCPVSCHERCSSAPRGRPVTPTACNSSDMDKHSDVRPIPLFTIVLWKVLNVVAFGLELSLLPYRISSAGAAAPRGVGRWLQQDLTLQTWTNTRLFRRFDMGNATTWYNESSFHAPQPSTHGTGHSTSPHGPHKRGDATLGMYFREKPSEEEGLR